MENATTGQAGRKEGTPIYGDFLRLLIGSWDPILKLMMDRVSERAPGSDAANPYRGLVVTASEAQEGLRRAGYPEAETERAAALSRRALRDAEALEAELAARKLPSPFASLCRRNGLSGAERDLLSLCLVQEADDRFERICAYLNDHAGRPYLTAHLAHDLIAALHGPAIAGEALSPHAPLFRARVLRMDAPAGGAGLAHWTVRLEADAAQYLAHGAEATAQSLALAEWLDASRAEADAEEAADASADPEALADRLRRAGRSGAALVECRGEYGSGGERAALRLARALGLNLYSLDAAALPAEALDLSERLEALYHNAWISDCAVLVRGLERIEDAPRERRALLAALSKYPVITVTEITTRAKPWWRLKGMDFFPLELPGPDAAARRRHWSRALDFTGRAEDLASLLAPRFEFTAGQIEEAARRVRNAAPRPAELEEALFREAANFEISDLDRLAQRIVPRFEWSDLVLPATVKERLREIVSRHRLSGRVYGEWGYGKKISRSRGINTLFFGESGTGKTMAAEVIGRELRLDVYKVDLSRLISKYIGETEKNLDRVFHEAEKTEVILFFDEADAIFSKRTEVKDAHDRHANVETSYLLQKMEEYGGLVILATNFQGNIDKAFFRRFHFSINFPMPEPRERLEIWRNVFPGGMKRSSGVDLEFVSRNIRLSGGNIRNAALASAFYAAEGGGEITMAGLLKGIHRELEKSGRMISSVNFGAYQSIIDEIR